MARKCHILCCEACDIGSRACFELLADNGAHRIATRLRTWPVNVLTRPPGGQKFDDPFVFFALVIAIVALGFARKAMNQVAELRHRLAAIQAAPAAAAALVPPPLTPFHAFEQTPPPIPR